VPLKGKGAKHNKGTEFAPEALKNNRTQVKLKKKSYVD
jgi:hypothetical protein